MSALSVLLEGGMIVTAWAAMYAAYRTVNNVINQWPEQVRMLQESTSHTVGEAVRSAVKVVVAPYASGLGPEEAADAAHMEVMPGWTDADTRVEEDYTDPTDAIEPDPAWMRPDIMVASADDPFGVPGLKRDPNRYGDTPGNADAGWGL